MGLLKRLFGTSEEKKAKIAKLKNQLAANKAKQATVKQIGRLLKKDPDGRDALRSMLEQLDTIGEPAHLVAARREAIENFLANQESFAAEFGEIDAAVDAAMQPDAIASELLPQLERIRESVDDADPLAKGKRELIDLGIASLKRRQQ